MNEKTYSQKADDAHNMCKLKGDSMLDNSDCTFHLEWLYDDVASAQDALNYYTTKAREVESEPCQITSRIDTTEQGVCLVADFVFCCQAEVILFQLRAR